MQAFKDHIESEAFLDLARKTQTAFTRLRKMPFCDMIYFITGSKRRCVQHELDEYFKQKGTESMSRQAFAKSRENVRPEAIKYLNESIIADFENGTGDGVVSS